MALSLTVPEYPIIPSEELCQTWNLYKQTDSHDLRDQLVLHYMALVRQCAGKISRRLPGSVQIEDLVSAGTIGLIDAIEKFRPERGLAFSTYSWHRISGAIMDDLRSQDWVPRRVRDWARRLDLSQGLPPDGPGEETKTPPRIGPLQLSDSGSRYSDDRFVDPRVESGLTAAMRRDLKKWLLSQLRPAERRIMIMYYFDELKQKEIGAVLGVTESRVSQILGDIHGKLKVHGRRLAA